jgi:enoyl-CoA hydratase
MATDAVIQIDREGPVDWVTLNRPEALNTLNDAMISGLSDYFQSIYARPETRIVVLRGAGRAFCAGLDLADEALIAGNSSGQGKVAYGLALQRRIRDIVVAMRRAPQPIISLVHGSACGGGFALALASDIRIAGASARFNAAFIRIGLSGCDIGTSYFLPRLVGVTVASELLMTGRFIYAERALNVGLVSQTVADEDLTAAAKPFITEMLGTSPLGLRLTKECLNINVDAGSLEAAIAMEDRNQILCGQTEDLEEALTAFREKRAPNYADR